MSVSTPCPPDSPLMIAWNAYKATEEYPFTKKWAAYPEHVEGSLWAAFMAGFNAQKGALSETQSALKALVDKLHECEPHISGAFFMQYTNRGAVYSGPDYGKELAEADRVLSGASK